MNKSILIWGFSLIFITLLIGFTIVYQNQQQLFQLNTDIQSNESTSNNKSIPELAIIPYLDEFPNIGDSQALVKMIVFLDYECVFSKKFINEQLPELRNEWVSKGELQIFFYDLPLKRHQKAQNLAINAHLAFQDSHFDAFLNDPLSFYNESISNERDIAKSIESSKQMAAIAGIQSTPTFVINNRVLPGLREFAELKSLINFSKNNKIENPQAGNTCK